MGVVRREGDWRLEKRDEGLYEITYQRDVQFRVRTPEYDPGPFEGPMIDGIPVRDVGSYVEAEGLFEEKANGRGHANYGRSKGRLQESISENVDPGIEPELTVGEGKLEAIDAPPGVIAIALVIVGGAVLWTQGWQPTEMIFQVGVLMIAAGAVILAWGTAVGRSRGWDQASEYLFESNGGSGTTEKPRSDSDVEKTPPLSEKTKNKLIFDRANQRCEWCGDRSDHLEVHHIEPRSEGGPNDPSNLIALCPNHHRQADAGGISKTKLNAKVRRLPEISVE